MLQGDDHPRANGTAGVPAPPEADDPHAVGPSLRHVCLELQDKVEAFLAEHVDTKLLKNVQSQVRDAVAVIDEALEKYSLEELSLSYNGGKDCLVLLVLILACLPRHFEPPPQPPPPAPTTTDQQQPPQPPGAPPSAAAALLHSQQHNSSSSRTTTTTTTTATSQPPPNTPLTATTPRAATPSPFPTALQSVYIVSPHPFAEVDAFVAQSAARYHLDLRRYGLPMRAALDAYLRDRPALRAVFVGTRRTDPHGANLRHFDPTDDGWPAFVRVHPVIDWHYAEIWAFIRHLGIPYLSLYDQGFTSLGGTEDTHPNPHLKKEDGTEGFRPAYELIEDDEERLGRDR